MCSLAGIGATLAALVLIVEGWNIKGFGEGPCFPIELPAEANRVRLFENVLVVKKPNQENATNVWHGDGAWLPVPSHFHFHNLVELLFRANGTNGYGVAWQFGWVLDGWNRGAEDGSAIVGLRNSGRLPEILK